MGLKSSREMSPCGTQMRDSVYYIVNICSAVYIRLMFSKQTQVNNLFKVRSMMKIFSFK